MLDRVHWKSGQGISFFFSHKTNAAKQTSPKELTAADMPLKSEKVDYLQAVGAGMGLHSSEPNQTKCKLLSKVIKNVFQSQYWFPVPVSFFTLCSTTHRSITFHSKHSNSAIFTALLDPTEYIYMLYLLRHKRRGVGVGVMVRVGSPVSGNGPGFENKGATPS